MSASKTDKLSFKAAMAISWRGYRLRWGRQPQLFIASALEAAAQALFPYVGIYLSARIINEIAGARERDTLTGLVLAALISAAVLGLVKGGLSRWKSYTLTGDWYRRNEVFTEKLLGMDFCALDDPRTYDLYAQTQQNDQWTGWGFTKLYLGFIALVRSLLTILGAVALAVSLFTLPVPQSAGALTLFNHPGFVAALVAVMLGTTFLAPTLSNRATVYWTKVTDEGKMGNRFFSFFGFLGGDEKRAMDMRMYRQDIMCADHMGKELTFTPDSTLAGYARGPMGGLHAASRAVSHVFTGIIYVFVCLKAWGGAFGVGSVTQYIGAITALSGGVSGLISAMGDLRNNAEFLRTSFELLDIPNDMYQGSLTTEKRSDNKYEIEFRNVSFKYPGTRVYALRDVSLAFRVGQRLAVVGQNGSGKTTFIKLLCRLYDPTEGEILLNGIDIRKYDYRQYMNIFSVVFQDYELLAFSLGQNVAASVSYDSAKVKDCLIGAGFGERLETMPKGLETCLYKAFEEDGVKVSGGEGQKIALARALYKDAPFVILDEPTAALDPVAEFEVYSRMNEIVGSKTAVFISHRLSSCRFCQDIAVFHEGQLIQRGGHADLLAQTQGKYHQLWHAQAQYYVNA